MAGVDGGLYEMGTRLVSQIPRNISSKGGGNATRNHTEEGRAKIKEFKKRR